LCCRLKKLTTLHLKKNNIMKNVEHVNDINDINLAISQWKLLKSYEISSNFELNSGNASPNGWPYQYNRLIGIDFGKITAEFKACIDSATENACVSLAAGISSSGFNLVFKRSDFGGSVYWEADHAETSRLYRLLPYKPEINAELRYGISPKLKDQLIFNWSTLPSYMIGDFFNSKVFYDSGPSKPLGVLETSIKDLPQPTEPNYYSDITEAMYKLKLCSSWVKTFEFLLDGANLDALKKILIHKDTFQSSIKVWFGVNFTNMLMADHMFTIIIEVDNREVTGLPIVCYPENMIKEFTPAETIAPVQYLDFVQACPPNCGGR
jgi:hypothetical protein